MLCGRACGCTLPTNNRRPRSIGCHGKSSAVLDRHRIKLELRAATLRLGLPEKHPGSSRTPCVAYWRAFFVSLFGRLAPSRRPAEEEERAAEREQPPAGEELGR